MIIDSQLSTVKLLVGDTMQSIYGFRHCINGFDVFPYKNLFLSTSYRMNQQVAGISNFISSFGRKFGAKIKPCKGLGKKENNTTCLISATNFGVYQNIVNCSEPFQVVGEYDWNQVISDMYDLHELSRNMPDKTKIRSFLLKNFKDISHFYAYVIDAQMLEWTGLIKFVKTFNTAGIVELKRKVFSQTVGADVYISNTHKAKGLEWNKVVLSDDYTCLEDILFKEDSKLNNREALNLLYVACTRAMTEVEIHPLIKKGMPDVVFNTNLYHV
jgi:superfamily I DNA/RNA helicase